MTETIPKPNSYRTGPDDRGHFGAYGGRYVAETLMPLVLDLEREYRAAKEDPAFRAQFDDLLEHYVGRPSPLYYAPCVPRQRTQQQRELTKFETRSTPAVGKRPPQKGDVDKV